jgi:hypothetical protein
MRPKKITTDPFFYFTGYAPSLFEFSNQLANAHAHHNTIPAEKNRQTKRSTPQDNQQKSNEKVTDREIF